MKLPDPTSQRVHSTGRNLRDTLDQLPWLVRAFLSYQRQQAVSRQATWLPRQETEPQTKQGSNCIVPFSTGDNDEGSSQLLHSNTQELGVSPEELEMCCYPCSRSSAGSAKQWGLFYSLQNSGRFYSQHKRAL